MDFTNLLSELQPHIHRQISSTLSWKKTFFSKTERCIQRLPNFQRCAETMFDAVQIPVSITYGIAQIADTNILHVWLKFEEHIIDNAFAGDNEEAFVRMKTSTIYIEDTSMLEKGNLFTGDEYTRTSLGYPTIMKRDFKYFLSDQMQFWRLAFEISHK